LSSDFGDKLIALPLLPLLLVVVVVGNVPFATGGEGGSAREGADALKSKCSPFAIAVTVGVACPLSIDTGSSVDALKHGVALALLLDVTLRTIRAPGIGEWDNGSGDVGSGIDAVEDLPFLVSKSSPDIGPPSSSLNSPVSCSCVWGWALGCDDESRDKCFCDCPIECRTSTSTSLTSEATLPFLWTVFNSGFSVSSELLALLSRPSPSNGDE